MLSSSCILLSFNGRHNGNFGCSHYWPNIKCLKSVYNGTYTEGTTETKHLFFPMKSVSPWKFHKTRMKSIPVSLGRRIEIEQRIDASLQWTLISLHCEINPPVSIFASQCRAKLRRPKLLRSLPWMVNSQRLKLPMAQRQLKKEGIMYVALAGEFCFRQDLTFHSSRPLQNWSRWEVKYH